MTAFDEAADRVANAVCEIPEPDRLTMSGYALARVLAAFPEAGELALAALATHSATACKWCWQHHEKVPEDLCAMGRFEYDAASELQDLLEGAIEGGGG